MKKQSFIYIKNFLIPCLFFSVAAGAFTGGLIFLFKQCASHVISLSSHLYGMVREDPKLLPLLLLGALLLGMGASVLLRYNPECRGGGIPASIALLRGLITFRWLRCILSVFTSAMMTYLCGVPLGNEGPSVQMGTAAGKGVVAFSPAWSRYIMTGGASAGFAAATGAPLTGILFAFEEAHRRFSPLLFLSASLSALTGSAVIKGLCALTNTEYALFHFGTASPLPMKYYWITAVIGIIVGLCAALFTKSYSIIRRFVRQTLAKFPFALKIGVIFLITAVIGFFSPESIGSGHDLVDHLMEGHGIGLVLILIFAIRALLLLVANNSDVTGGLFVPTLALGAIIGALCGKGFTMLNLLPDEFFSIAVITGIAAFMSASSRTPLMALSFSVEVLGGSANLLPIAIGSAIAFLCIESTGMADFSDIVVEARTEAEHAGKTAKTVDLHLTVAHDSFVVGKEIRDILWPPSCVVLSVKHAESNHAHGGIGIKEGDILHVHCTTYDSDALLKNLEALTGKQKSGTFDALSSAEAAEEDASMPET